LLDKYPEYVIKRYESGSIATNADCDVIYRLALEKVGKEPARQEYKLGREFSSRGNMPLTVSSSEQPRFTVGSQENPRQVSAGMKGNPVHVVIDEGR